MQTVLVGMRMAGAVELWRFWREEGTWKSPRSSAISLPLVLACSCSGSPTAKAGKRVANSVKIREESFPGTGLRRLGAFGRIRGGCLR